MRTLYGATVFSPVCRVDHWQPERLDRFAPVVSTATNTATPVAVFVLLIYRGLSGVHSVDLPEISLLSGCEKFFLALG
jgi:hypothetical protein